MSIKVLLADDHGMFREGIRALLERHDDIEVVAEADDGRTAVRMARKLKPDVVVMDISMPDTNGVEATRQICRRSRRVKVIALSMHSDKRFVARMLEAGAAGYLLKDCAFDELVQAVRAVVEGHRCLSQAIADTVIDDYVRGAAPHETGLLSVLSPREGEVLQLLAEGVAAKQIAARLHVSPSTIETHRGRIMQKLDLHSIAALTKFAVREGLTSPDP